jgi:hypothetical protein
MSTEVKLEAYMAIDERVVVRREILALFFLGNTRNQPQALKRNPFSVTEWHE